MRMMIAAGGTGGHVYPAIAVAEALIARHPGAEITFVGSVDGVDVSAAGYSRSGTTAVLWGVGTLEEHRGRGHGEAVSRLALAHAAERGCTTASLRSGPKSIPLYERIGFRYVCQHRTYAEPGK